MPLAIVWLIGIAVTATKWMLLLPVVLGGPLVALFWINGAVEERARLRSIAPEQSRRSRIWFYVWAAVFFSILLLSWILAG